MKILHVIAGCWKSSGGPSEVVPNLCKQLAEQGNSITLLTVDGDHSSGVYAAEKSGVNLVSLPEKYISFIRFVPGMYRFLWENVQHFDVVHNHGHWLYPNWITFFACRFFNKPLVTTPHGTLVPGMLRSSSFKKFLSWRMFDKRLINYSSVIHFLSDNERNLSLQKIGGLARQKVRVLPNGAAKESLAKPGWRKRFDKLDIHKKNLLFMGRVSKIKGLQDLLVVWQELKPELWNLTIVGPWDDDMLELRKSINDDNSIRVIGPVYGDARFEYLNKADAFILPSYGEGLPTALLEAANNAKVILCSHECNFDSLEKVDGGYFFTCGQLGVNSALNRLFEATADETLRRSSLAYSLARDLYSWDAVGGIWEKEYQRLLDCI